MSLTATAVRVLPEPVRTLGFAAISGSYAAIGTPFNYPIHYFMIQNLSDAAAMISWNGTDDHFPLEVNGYIIMDVSSNRTSTGGSFMISQGTQFYAKALTASLPTTGNIYLSVFYGFVNA